MKEVVEKKNLRFLTGINEKRKRDFSNCRPVVSYYTHARLECNHLVTLSTKVRVDPGKETRLGGKLAEWGQ